MPTSLPLRAKAIRREMIDRYREHAARARAGREHDVAIASDHRFATEHRIQVIRALEAGRGGCPYCR